MRKTRILLAALALLFARPAQAQNDPNLAKYVVKAGGFFTSPFQPKSYANGSEPSNPRTGDTIYSSTDTSLRVYTGASWTSLALGGAGSAFSTITAGTNTGQALLVGSGSSLGTTSSGTINATALNSATFAAPGTIGGTTPGIAVFRTSLTVDTATATDDRIIIAPTAGGAARFDLTLTQADQTGAGHTQTFPSVTGTFITTGNLTDITQLNGLVSMAGSSTPALSILDNGALTAGKGGSLFLQHLSTLGATVTYASINGAAIDGTSGAEIGDLVFQTMTSGTRTEKGRFLGTTGALIVGVASTRNGLLSMASANSAFYTSIKADGALATRVYTWPTDFGAAGTVLTDAAGNGALSWAVGSSVSLSGTNTWTAAQTFAPTTQGVAPVVVTQPVGTSGTPGVALTVTGGAHTGLANALQVDGSFNSARTVTFSGGGGAFTQYAYNFAAPTYTAAAAQTLTALATVRISGAPTTSAAGGATPTITNYGNGTAGAFGDALHVVTGRVLIGASYSNVNTMSDTLTALVVNGPGAYGVAHLTGSTAGRIEFNKAGDATQTFISGGAGHTVMRSGLTTHISSAWGTIFGPDNSPTNARAMVEILPTAAAINLTPLMRLTSISPDWNGGGFAASTETHVVHFDFNTNTSNWNTGALTTQRFFNITQPTITFAAASVVTDAATVAIGGAPVQGSNSTLTRSMALWVQAGLARFGGHIGSTQTTKPTTTLTSTTLNDGAGAGATITVANGSTDTVGQITITAGNGVPTAGIVGQIVFDGAYTTAPKACMLQAMTSGGGARLMYVPSASITTAQFQLYNDVAFVSASSHSFMYQCWE